MGEYCKLEPELLPIPAEHLPQPKQLKQLTAEVTGSFRKRHIKNMSVLSRNNTYLFVYLKSLLKKVSIYMYISNAEIYIYMYISHIF